MTKITKEEKKRYNELQSKFSNVEEKVLSCIWLMENFPANTSEAMMLLIKAYMSFQGLVKDFYNENDNAKNTEPNIEETTNDDSFASDINNSIKDILKRALKPKDYKFYEDNYQKFFSFKDTLFNVQNLQKEDSKLIEKFCEILSISLNKVIHEIQKKYKYDFKSVFIRSLKWIILALLIIGGISYNAKAKKYGTYNFLNWKAFDDNWTLKVIRQDYGVLGKEVSVDRNICKVPSQDTPQNVNKDEKPYYTSAKCYGTHSNSRLELTFKSKFEKFEGKCGKDLECGYGTIKCLIKDEKDNVLFESQVLNNQTKFAAFSVPVKDLSKIYLEISDAQDGNGCDHADWLDLVVK